MKPIDRVCGARTLACRVDTPVDTSGSAERRASTRVSTRHAGVRAPRHTSTGLARVFEGACATMNHMNTTTSVCDYFDSGASFGATSTEPATSLPSFTRNAAQPCCRWWIRSICRCALEVLEIGCGAGLTSVALAQRGHSVIATDVAPAMLALTRKLVAQAEVDDLVQTRSCRRTVSVRLTMLSPFAGDRRLRGCRLWTNPA